LIGVFGASRLLIASQRIAALAGVAFQDAMFVKAHGNFTICIPPNGSGERPPSEACSREHIDRSSSPNGSESSAPGGGSAPPDCAAFSR
jgi:hypothetical protein